MKTYVVSAAIELRADSPDAAAKRFKTLLGEPPILTVVRVMEIPLELEEELAGDYFNGEVSL